MLKDLLFPNLALEEWKIDINLADEAKGLPTKRPANWIKNLHAELGVKYSCGGYLENRQYLLSYQEPQNCIHIGMDFIVPANTQVVLPKIAKVMMTEFDTDSKGGWGTRIIVRIAGNYRKPIYACFAHLSSSLVSVGTVYPSGTVLGKIGNRKSNGGWFPHLHVHCMRDYEPWSDAYQPDSWDLQSRFPDPEIVFNNG
jgi:murein DD-endopeptidase MepM/ murein hydrolase activator NlpD